MPRCYPTFNPMKNLFVLLLLLRLGILTAQRDTIHRNCTTVIAVSGLNIREQPGTRAKVLGKIPFGGKIKYLSPYAFGADTIRDYPHMNGVDNFEFVGRWANIQYKGIRGYVLDTYLYHPETAPADTSEYALLYPEVACFANIHHPAAYHWYGMFKTADGKFNLKSVKINYFSYTNDAFGGKDFGVSTGNDQGLMCIIGSRQLLPEGSRRCADPSQIPRGSDLLRGYEYLRSFGIRRQSEEPEASQFHTFVVTHGSRKQYLKPDQATGSDWPQMAVSFAGDINGDEVMDYIFTPYSESGRDVLFISNPGGWRAVGYFWWHYCC